MQSILLFYIQLFLVFTKMMIPVIEKKDCLIRKLFESDYRECHACRVSVMSVVSIVNVMCYECPQEREISVSF